MIRSIAALALLVTVCASGCVVGSAPSRDTGGTVPSTTPPELVGTWTAGRGGTTVSYDTLTGTSSSNASGLAYRFAADGTFAKAYRDSTGGGCATVVVGTEAGTVAWGDGHLDLRSDHGTVQSWSTCSPGAVASQPMRTADLDRAGYAFRLEGDELVLVRDDGASARFRRSPE